MVSDSVCIKHEDCVLISSVDMLRSVLSSFTGDVVAFDTETTGLNPVSDSLVGISFSFEDSVKAYYIPLAHAGFDGNLSLDSVISVLQSFFSGNVRLVFHNFKFDYKFLKHAGISFHGVDVFDTMVCAFLLNAESRRYSLAFLVKKYFNYDMLPFSEVTGLYGGSFERVPIGNAVIYACEDAFYTIFLYKVLWSEVKDKDFLNLLSDVEFPLIPILADMENVGFKLDIKRLECILHDSKDKLSVLEREIYDVVGKEFNICSNKQLGDVLENVFKVKVRHTKKRSVKVDAGALEEYSKVCDRVLPIVEYKKLSSLVSKFLIPLLNGVVDGKIHCNFNQCMVRTGRLSCSSPNLQNIPKASDSEGLIRSCFLPLDSDSVVLCADYSQVELRILATLSKEDNMLDAFREGVDLHDRVAKFLFGIATDTVSEEERFKAKTLNFGILYGMKPFGLSKRLGISYVEADRLLKAFFLQFPMLKPFMNSMIDFAFLHGYVYTFLNRRCWIPYFLNGSSNPFHLDFAKRQAVNSVIQGSCADLIKKAMVDVVRELKREGLKAVLLLQVHDELVFSVPKSEVVKVKAIVKECMECVIVLNVPLVVDIGIGNSWYVAKK